MKRNFDLIREVLLLVENNSNPQGFQLPDICQIFTQYDCETIGYNMGLMIEARLVNGEMYGHPVEGGIILNLTWSGHDFLDNARSDTVWNSVKLKLLKVGGGASLDVVKDLLSKTVETFLNSS